MNCDEVPAGSIVGTTGAALDGIQCRKWVKSNQCAQNSDYMKDHCAVSCNIKDRNISDCTNILRYSGTITFPQPIEAIGTNWRTPDLDVTTSPSSFEIIYARLNSRTKKGILKISTNGVVAQSRIYDPTITDDQIIDINADGSGSLTKAGESSPLSYGYTFDVNVGNVTNSQATLTVSGSGNGTIANWGEYNASFDSTTVTLTGDPTNTLPTPPPPPPPPSYDAPCGSNVNEQALQFSNGYRQFCLGENLWDNGLSSPSCSDSGQCMTVMRPWAQNCFQQGDYNSLADQNGATRFQGQVLRNLGDDARQTAGMGLKDNIQNFFRCVSG